MRPTNWIDYDPSFIRQRYNDIASFFPFFELLFLLPPGIRRKAVRRLQLRPGDILLTDFLAGLVRVDPSTGSQTLINGTGRNTLSHRSVEKRGL